MPSAVSNCPDCGKPGRWGIDDDWCHENTDDAIACPREGFYPFGEPEADDGVLTGRTSTTTSTSPPASPNSAPSTRTGPIMPKYDVKVTACYQVEAADPFEAAIKAVDIDMRPPPSWTAATRRTGTATGGGRPSVPEMYVPKRDEHLMVFWALAVHMLDDPAMLGAFRQRVLLFEDDPDIAVADVQKARDFFHDEMHDIMTVATANWADHA